MNVKTKRLPWSPEVRSRRVRKKLVFPVPGPAMISFRWLSDLRIRSIASRSSDPTSSGTSGEATLRLVFSDMGGMVPDQDLQSSRLESAQIKAGEIIVDRVRDWSYMTGRIADSS